MITLAAIKAVFITTYSDSPKTPYTSLLATATSKDDSQPRNIALSDLNDDEFIDFISAVSCSEVS
ncbi:MAG: hypothetical protein QMC38_18275 [Sinobacterium sp.]